MSKRNAPHELTKAAFAETFGVSEVHLVRLFHEGMPHEKRGRRVYLPMPDARVWYHKWLTEKGRRQVERMSMDEAKQRKITAEAALAELELARACDELMTVADFDRVIMDAFGRVRARLQNLAPRLAGVVVGTETEQEGLARVEPLVREVMEELRRADDVPESNSPDSDAERTDPSEDPGVVPAEQSPRKARRGRR